MTKINFNKLSDALTRGNKEEAYATAKQMTPVVKRKIRSQLSGIEKLNFDIQSRG